MCRAEDRSDGESHAGRLLSVLSVCVCLVGGMEEPVGGKEGQEQGRGRRRGGIRWTGMRGWQGGMSGRAEKLCVNDGDDAC